MSYHTILQVSLQDTETGPKVFKHTWWNEELVFFLYLSAMAGSHSLMVRSFDEDATILPSGEKATA